MYMRCEFGLYLYSILLFTPAYLILFRLYVYVYVDDSNWNAIRV